MNGLEIHPLTPANAVAFDAKDLVGQLADPSFRARGRYFNNSMIPLSEAGVMLRWDEVDRIGCPDDQGNPGEPDLRVCEPTLTGVQAFVDDYTAELNRLEEVGHGRLTVVRHRRFLVPADPWNNNRPVVYTAAQLLAEQRAFDAKNPDYPQDRYQQVRAAVIEYYLGATSTGWYIDPANPPQFNWDKVFLDLDLWMSNDPRLALKSL